MPENPLLPNAELRALLQLLQDAEVESSAARQSAGRGSAGRKQAGPHPALGTEALLAATLLQLRAGDVVLPELHDASVASLTGKKHTRSRQPKDYPLGRPEVLTASGGAPRLMLAAGAAAALRRAGDNRLVLTFCRALSDEAHWAEAFTWAQQESLPLIVVCIDASGAEAFREPEGITPDELSWKTMQRTSGRLKLPVLAVDGQDAVAVFRVMQESVLRARAQGGPAVLWSVLPTPQDLRKPYATGRSPLARLEEYLRVRKIAVPAKRGVV